MSHSHQILDITDLRNETSRNSSSLRFQDIAVLVLLLALSLLLPSAIRPPVWLWATAHAGLSALCSAQSPWAGPSSPGVQTLAPLTTPHPHMHSANTWLLLCASCCSRLQDAAGNRLFKDLTLLERFLIRSGLLEERG